MRRGFARATAVLIAAMIVAPAAGPAAAKLPPVDASAPVVVPVGRLVPVEMWFVDPDGVPLPDGETASWVPTRVGGWMWPTRLDGASRIPAIQGSGSPSGGATDGTAARSCRTSTGRGS